MPLNPKLHLQIALLSVVKFTEHCMLFLTCELLHMLALFSLTLTNLQVSGFSLRLFSLRPHRCHTVVLPSHSVPGITVYLFTSLSPGPDYESDDTVPSTYVSVHN